MDFIRSFVLEFRFQVAHEYVSVGWGHFSANCSALSLEVVFTIKFKYTVLEDYIDEFSNYLRRRLTRVGIIPVQRAIFQAFTFVSLIEMNGREGRKGRGGMER